MKLQCCPLPTSIFSNHTGFDSFAFIDFTPHMAAYTEQWEKLDLQFSGILTGYLGSPEQIGLVKHFLTRFKGAQTTVVIDPVMGDNGKLYPSFSPALAAKLGELVPFADLLTPNLTEACILTQTPYRADMDDAALTALCRALSEMGPKSIVISGLEREQELANFIYHQGQTVTVTEPRVGPNRSGTGDVFSSILVADAVNGVPLEESVRHAAAFIAKVLRRTVDLNLPQTDGLCFEEFLTQL